jgi:isochorismate pyruvate lyase
MENCLKKPNECSSINDVRNEIDRIDEEIIRLLGERYLYVKEVVKYKLPDKESITAQERYNNVINERKRLAEMHGLDSDIIEHVYRKLLDYFIDKQLDIAKVKE